MRLPWDEFRNEDDVDRGRTRSDAFSAACNQIRQAFANKPEVSIRMLEMLADDKVIGQRTKS